MDILPLHGVTLLTDHLIASILLDEWAAAIAGSLS